MIPLPKPRGFWDYALFALAMTGILSLLFWMESTDGLGWVDAALSFASSVFLVVLIVLFRREEKAAWIKQPTRRVYLIASLGAFTLIFAAMYADAYLFHRRDITARRFWHDVVFAIVLTAGMLWSSRKRLAGRRQAL